VGWTRLVERRLRRLGWVVVRRFVARIRGVGTHSTPAIIKDCATGALVAWP